MRPFLILIRCSFESPFVNGRASLSASQFYEGMVLFPVCRNAYLRNSGTFAIRRNMAVGLPVGSPAGCVVLVASQVLLRRDRICSDKSRHKAIEL